MALPGAPRSLPLALLLVLPGPTACTSAPGHRGLAADQVATTVEVFYATDRELVESEEGRAEYGWQRAYDDPDRPCDLGVCRVEIRRKRHNDTLGALPTSRGELVSVISTTVLEPDRFFGRVREKMWYAGENDTFVFVHGYNNSFEDSAKRAAEIWYDLGFGGPPILYSWPSRGGRFWRGVFGYFADSESVKWSAQHLKTFLLDLVKETSADRLFADEPARIHLVAHSMGCQALVRALLLIADDMKKADRPIFCDVVMAAPDIDRDLFRDVMALQLLTSHLAQHYTLYASDADAVIKTSGKLQVYPRIGNATDGLVPVQHPDFDTIDASAVKSSWLSLNHDYFVTEPRMIRDLIEVLRKSNRDPGSNGRFMHRRGEGPGQPWVLMPDDHMFAEAAAE